jgi:hypothetical protein
MGAAKPVTADLRLEFEQYRQRVERAMADRHITDREIRECAEEGDRVDHRIALVDSRMRLIRFATGDVRSIRDIEEHSARNNITPLVFDFGPSPEAA